MGSDKTRREAGDFCQEIGRMLTSLMRKLRA
jgi:hypothetical protein